MNRDFKGIWIPREIWLSDLLCQEKCLWAEIHSLFDREKGGCYASNEYLCEFIGVQERRLREMMANLKEKGWLVHVSFDGRTRVIKAVVPAEDFKNNINNEDEFAGQTGIIMPGRDALKCRAEGNLNAAPSIYREKSIDKSIESLLKVPEEPEKRSEKPSLDSFSCTALETSQFMVDSMRIVKPDYGAQNGKWLGILIEVDKMIRLDKRAPEKIIEVFRWALADSFWASKMFKPNPAKYLRDKFDQLEMTMNAKPTDPKKVDRRTKNMDGTPVAGEQYKGLF